MSEHYILQGHEAVPADLMTWATWFETHNSDRIVAKTEVGPSRVSTVFLGLNHAYGAGPPLLFETMVFDGPLEGEQERCTTWEQAEAQHAAMVERVRANVDQNVQPTMAFSQVNDPDDFTPSSIAIPMPEPEPALVGGGGSFDGGGASSSWDSSSSDSGSSSDSSSSSSDSGGGSFDP